MERALITPLPRIERPKACTGNESRWNDDCTTRCTSCCGRIGTPPAEAAELLQIGIDVLRHAAFTGELSAQIFEHDIISLQRADILAWLDASDVRERAGRLPIDS
jgi:hypothetical protein